MAWRCVPWCDERYTVFVGESRLKGGQEWGAELEAAIRNCALFLPVISHTYGHVQRSKWTYREVGARVGGWNGPL